jgi:hypothetical protein
MKKFLLPFLAAGLGLFSMGTALAQDKPALNTAPPGTPTPPPTTQPATTPPTTVPATPPPAAEPASLPPPAPTPDKPSGLDFPQRPATEIPKQADAPYKKMFIYSNFGLGYSGYDDVSQFNVSAAPALGYRFNERFAAGPGISYTYNNYSFAGFQGNPGVSMSTSSFGVKAFAQFIVYNEFFLHAEYEVTKAEGLLVDQYGFLTGEKVKRTVETPLAGAGYRQQLSDNVAADIVLLYNFNDGRESIYSNPVIRFSFLFNIGR